MKIKSFKDWKILTKILSISITTIVLLIAGVVFYVLPYMAHHLLQEKEMATKGVVDTAASLIESHLQDAKDGKITLQAAGVGAKKDKGVWLNVFCPEDSCLWKGGTDLT